MKSKWESEWESMTIDELFQLRELMQDVLMKRLEAQKAELERRLKTLGQAPSDGGPTTRNPKSGRKT